MKQTGSRAERKAAAAAAKESAKAAAEQERSDRKARKAGSRSDRKARKQVAEAVDGDKSAREPMTAKRAKRLIGVGKVVAPALAPYALAAANTARAAWDNRRAARLGVAQDQLGAFAGPGGALHARLSHVADALTTLETTDGSAAAKAIIERTRPRLADLSVAVRAAEQMPAPRRRSAYKAIGSELDTIEAALLDHLGVRTS